MDIHLSHPFFTTREQIEQICKPLFLYTPFQYFDYQRYYFNGLHLSLASQTDFGYEIMKQDLLPSLEELQQNKSHYVCLSSSLLLPELVIEKNKFIRNLDLSNEHKIYHRLYVNFNTPKYVEVFGFGLANSIHNITETFMNHTAAAERFCVYFREAARDLIIQMKPTMLRYDDFEDHTFFKDLDFKTDSSYMNFLHHIKLKSFHIQGKHGQCKLSEREIECLLWVSKNKTAKQISRILSLSPRTIESYLINLKNKMGCESKEELIQMAFKNNSIKNFIE